MGTFDVRDMLKADAAAAETAGFKAEAPQGEHRLSPLATRIAALPVKSTLSPVLIEGCVRLLDMLTVALVGGLVYWLYVAGTLENTSPYQFTIAGLAVGALIAFQALHLYQLGALRHFLSMAARIVAGWTMLWQLWRGSSAFGAIATIDPRLRRAAPRILAAALVMAAALVGLERLLAGMLAANGIRYLALLLLCTAGLAVYAAAAFATGALRPADLRAALRRGA